MSEQQFLLGLIAPITTIAVVLVGFLYNNSRISDINARIGDIAARVDARSNDLSTRFDGRFNDLSSQFDGRANDLSNRFEGRFGDLSNRFDGRFNDLSGAVGTRLSDLKDLIKAEGESWNANLRRVEEMMLGKFAEVDNRLNRIESYFKIH